MNRSERDSQSQYDPCSGGRRPAPVQQHYRQQNAQQCEDRANGQIDPAGDDHNSDADAEYSVGSDQPAHVLDVGRTEELWIPKCDDRAKNNEERQNA